MKRVRNASPMRRALQMVWDLNIKTMPTAVVWAISFWFVIETHSILIRFIAISFANLAALSSGILIVKSSHSRERSSWKVWILDSFSWKALLGTGLMLGLSLENLSRTQPSSMAGKLFYLSIFVSSLILWLFVLVVLVPLRVQMKRTEDQLKVLRRAIDYVRCCKPYLLISLSAMLFGWPFLFVYAFLALTFAQCMTLSSNEDIVDASISSLDMRVHIA